MVDTDTTNPAVKDCCKDETNLAATQLSPELMVKVCQECGCRHFELDAEVAILGAMGAGL